jgi:maltose-binding protein MalE
MDMRTREVTAALLKWLTGTEVQIALARGLSVQPADIAAGRVEEIQNDPVLLASRSQIEKGRLMPIVPEMRAIWDAMRPSYQSVMNGELSPEDAARAMQEKAATMIERMRE